MKKMGAVLTFLLVFPTGWCASDVSREAAGETIDKSLRSKSVVISLEVGRVGAKCAGEAAEVLNNDPTSDIQFITAQKAGLITIAPDGPNFWKVTLSGVKPEILESVKKIPHKIANGCDSQTVKFAIARESLVEIVKISQVNDATAEVDFTWKWAPFPPYVKLAEQLSAAQQKELEGYLSRSVPPTEDTHFSVADISQAAKPNAEQRTLKKSDNGWRLALDRKTASQVIEKELASEPKVIFAQVGRIGSSCVTMVGDKEVEMDINPQTDADMVAAAKAGYISFLPNGKGYWQVTLTSKGKGVISGDSGNKGLYAHNTLKGCDFQQVGFTVARRSLIEITGLTDDGGLPEVEYLWKWAPTDLGVALREKGAIYSALTASQRDRLRQSLASTDLSPALSLPVPPEENAATRSKVKLRRSNDTWLW
jgi:hypothetical protein